MRVVSNATIEFLTLSVVDIMHHVRERCERARRRSFLPCDQRFLRLRKMGIDIRKAEAA